MLFRSEIFAEISISKREYGDVNKSIVSRNILEILKNQQLKIKLERNLQKARTFKNILVCEVCKKLFDRKSLLIRHHRYRKLTCSSLETLKFVHNCS